jgi:STE24 endopeptidase
LGNEDKATRYHRRRRRAALFRTAAVGAFLLTLLITGIGPQLREYPAMVGMVVGGGFEEAVTVAAFAMLLVILVSVVELPFAFYQGFLLEHRYGLSTESPGQWFLDQLKGTALGIVFGAAGASVVYSAIRFSPQWWWLIAAAAFVVLLVATVQLAPVLLMPLFYSFKPLDRPELTERLMRLAAQARTRVRGVYEWALSAHTRKANAALAGFGRTRRILLSDTLLADYSDDEIEVVLAHELSHHVHHDLWRGIALQTVVLVFTFYIAHLALAAWSEPLGLRGGDDPAGMPLLLLVAGACSLVFMPLANALSRAHERRADRYALEATQRPTAFISAMKRLSHQNLAEENPSTLVVWLFYSHPPIRERIRAAQQWQTTRRSSGTSVHLG